MEDGVSLQHRSAETFNDNTVLVWGDWLVSRASPADVLNMIVHEAQHIAGHRGETVPYAVTADDGCYKNSIRSEEEEEDGGDGGTRRGGGGGSGENGGQPRIAQHPTIPTLWVIVTLPPGVTVTIGDIGTVCDYDPDTSWPDCEEALEEANAGNG